MRDLRAQPRPPLLSVVVPFHRDSATLLATVESLLSQTLTDLEVILVSDGADAGSLAVAEQCASSDARIRMVQQPQGGVAAARNTGVSHSKGEFLAFCDADDTVPPTAYERMVQALQGSGSDLAVGSLTLEDRGRHREPAWARTSNARRRTNASLATTPEVIINHYVGNRVFRRAFWVANDLAFDTRGSQADIVPMVRSLLLASSYDVLPAIVYRWHWRTDGTSLYQRTLHEPERVADLVSRLHEAGELVLETAGEEVMTTYFVGVLHTVVADLVRAAMANEERFWAMLSAELRRLTDLIPSTTWAQVPVEDRVIAWLCARDHRAATEEFLTYSFDNPTGYPHEILDGIPHVAMPVINELSDSSGGLTAVAEADLQFRTRLAALRWVTQTQLEVVGIALVEYLSATSVDTSTEVVLVERGTGAEHRFPTRSAPDVRANRFASRVNEDHSQAGFQVRVDLDQLPLDTTSRQTYDVLVEHRAGGRTWRAGFGTRQVEGSAGLLESSVVGQATVVPVWRKNEGLSLLVKKAPDDSSQRASDGPETAVQDLEPAADHLLVRVASSSRVELALHGPRSRTSWIPAEPDGSGLVARLPLTQDDWGVGVAPLPADRYELMCRTDDGKETIVACAAQLWRRLPMVTVAGDLHFDPGVTADGGLHVRIAPVEWLEANTSYGRRQLREGLYPAARERPLVDAVLFETFAGRAAGDNPGAICRELAQRDEELDLVYSVDDRSICVPDGARKVVRFSAEYFELLGRARYLVVNASLPYFFRKREGQLYFQTWHGTPLKRLGHDRVHLDFYNWHHRRQLLVARAQWDFLLSQSEICTRSLTSAFRYDGPVLEVGYPRNDVMLTAEAPERRARTRRNLGIPDHARVVLYAPTWRDNLRTGHVFDKVLYLEPEKLVRDIEDCVVLVRGHYNSIKAAEDVDPDSRIMDVTRYPDIADLYLAADALVTDYSSVFFDFALVDRPMAFLAPDLVAYRDDNRGFYLDYHETVPGPICETTEEVIAALQAPDTYQGTRADFRKRFAPRDDGHASARVVDAILEARPYR